MSLLGLVEMKAAKKKNSKHRTMFRHFLGPSLWACVYLPKHSICAPAAARHHAVMGKVVGSFPQPFFGTAPGNRRPKQTSRCNTSNLAPSNPCNSKQYPDPNPKPLKYVGLSPARVLSAQTAVTKFLDFGFSFFIRVSSTDCHFFPSARHRRLPST